LSLSYFQILRLLEIVGEGAFGSVYKAKHVDSNQILAIKIVAIGEENTSPEAKKQRDEIQKEIEILKTCKSPYIVSYFGSAIDKHDDGMLDLWIVMDFMNKVRILFVFEANRHIILS